MKISIGIIGAQSKHAEFFGAVFNREERFPGCRVERICAPDEPSRLPYVLGLTDISLVCETPEQVIAESDAVLITTRRGETHYTWAEAALNAGKPVFVDKPFIPEPTGAKKLLSLAKHSGVPLVAGSTLCFLPDAEALCDPLSKSDSILIQYKADPDSEFGGYSFYGSHLTDLCSLWFSGARSVRALRNGGNVTSVVSYDTRRVVLASALEAERVAVSYFAGSRPLQVTIRDEDCYRRGMDTFVGAITDNAAPDMSRLVESCALLSAINASLADGEEKQIIL